MILAGFAVFAGCAMIAVQLVEINKTMKMIIKRYAALENLGLFPEEDSQRERKNQEMSDLETLGHAFDAEARKAAFPEDEGGITAYNDGYKEGYRRGQASAESALRMVEWRAIYDPDTHELLGQVCLWCSRKPHAPDCIRQEVLNNLTP